MPPKLKPILAVLACQAVCTAAGLWIHSRFVVSAAEWNVQEQAAAEIPARAARLAPRVLEITANEWKDGTTPTKWEPQLAQLERDHQVGLLVVDAAWKLRRPSAEVPQYRAGDGLIWESPTGTAGLDGAVQAGSLRLETTRFPAAAIPLKHGYALVVPHPERLEPTAAALLRALPLSAVIAFVWINGVQAIVVYLVIIRLESETERVKTSSRDQVFRRAQELVRTQDAIIFGLAKLAESRDPDTGLHLERISLYSTQLAQALSQSPQYRQTITPQFVRLIGISSALHDIGKVGVRDSILLKPGELTEAERSEMQKHTAIGGECLKKIEQRLGTSNFLQMAREIALFHHERWDGRGYPNGLSGTEIPLAARIVAIADVYDALSMKRCYKPALSHETCVAMIAAEAGSQFDPELVEAFAAIAPRFEEIAQQFCESRSPVPSPSSPSHSVLTAEIREILERAGVREHRPDFSSALAGVP